MRPPVRSTVPPQQATSSQESRLTQWIIIQIKMAFAPKDPTTVRATKLRSIESI
jgi:hypothetical protein